MNRNSQLNKKIEKEDFMKKLLLNEKIFLEDKNVLIFIISIPIEIGIDELKQYTYILDSEEVKQFNKYKIEKKQIEFLIGRILLKGILGNIFKKNAREISFSKNEYGKLYLSNQPHGLNLNFNLSHTDGKLVCGITRVGRLGIDVENTEIDYLELMEMFFLPKEISYVNSQSDFKNRKNLFYQIFTRKEAYMKLIGKGFSLSPFTFTVPLCKDVNPNEDILYYSFNPSAGYMLSVAVEKIDKNQEVIFNKNYLQIEQLIPLIV